jgi:excisionase family DNA binding protein
VIIGASVVPMNDTANTWFTREEAAAYLRCSLPTLDRYAKSGQLPKRQLGRSPRFKKEDLDALVQPSDDSELCRCGG